MLNLQELSLQRDFAAASRTLDSQLSGDWEERVNEYVADLRAGLASLNADPHDPEDQQGIFE